MVYTIDVLPSSELCVKSYFRLVLGWVIVCGRVNHLGM